MRSFPLGTLGVREERGFPPAEASFDAEREVRGVSGPHRTLCVREDPEHAAGDKAMRKRRPAGA